VAALTAKNHEKTLIFEKMDMFFENFTPNFFNTD